MKNSNADDHDDHLEPVTPRRVDLRELFPEERMYFSPYLVDHIAELGNAIGKRLVSARSEQKFGSKTIDVVAGTEGSEVLVIEGQLGPSDTSHIYKALFYAQRTGAIGIVWVASQFSTERTAIINWLNEISNLSMSFYAVEAQAYKVGATAMVIFQCVAGPVISLDDLSNRERGYALQPHKFCWRDALHTEYYVGSWKDLYERILQSAGRSGVDLADLSLCPTEGADRREKVPDPIVVETACGTYLFEDRGDAEETKERISLVLNRMGREIIVLLKYGKRIVLPEPPMRLDFSGGEPIPVPDK